ncbi:MAG: DUF5013 domain-containing protein [Ferruginibacter sp.]|nr:DUF5013 domain-containing protein [Ferruginibacter sp.]
MKKIEITGCWVCMLLLIICNSCSKIDAYKSKYAAASSIVYPGKIDSVKVFSGKNRVKITGLFTSDPKIVKYRIFWYNKQDSVEIPIKRTAGVDTASLFIPNLPEGLISFEIRTYDIEGNASIPVFIAGNVYGDLYQSNLTNRGIIGASLAIDGAAVVHWSDIDAGAGMQGIQLQYINNSNVTIDTLLASIPANMYTNLPDFQQGNNFSYRSVFLPSPTAIDTFFVNYSKSPNIYFVNGGNPFFAKTSAGRWGVLAGWTTTPNVVNHDNMTTGGWVADQGGCISMVKGWDWSPSIINGKIYETIMLDPGTYTFFIDMGWDDAIDPVYIVASAGNTLPDVDNLSAALGYSSFRNLKMQFTVPQRQAVSIGFLATLTTGNQFWAVKSVKLVKS